MWTRADFNQSRWAQSPGKGLKGKDRHMWLKAKGLGPVLPEIVQFSGLGSCPLPLTFCSPWTLASLCSSVGEKVPVCLRPTGPAKILEVLGSQLVWPEALGRQPSCGGHSGEDGMLAIEGWAGRSCWVGAPQGRNSKSRASDLGVAWRPFGGPSSCGQGGGVGCQDRLLAYLRLRGCKS